ncbi:hypothetical protein ACNKHR_04350 [Shigella flexneri]
MRWDFAPLQSLELGAGYSRQGNLEPADTQSPTPTLYPLEIWR